MGKRHEEELLREQGPLKDIPTGNVKKALKKHLDDGGTTLAWVRSKKPASLYSQATETERRTVYSHLKDAEYLAQATGYHNRYGAKKRTPIIDPLIKKQNTVDAIKRGATMGGLTAVGFLIPVIILCCMMGAAPGIVAAAIIGCLALASAIGIKTGKDTHQARQEEHDGFMKNHDPEKGMVDPSELGDVDDHYPDNTEHFEESERRGSTLGF